MTKKIKKAIGDLLAAADATAKIVEILEEKSDEDGKAQAGD